MADPIIRIMVEQGAPGSQPGSPGSSSASGQPQSSHAATSTDGEDNSEGKVAKALKAMFGRLVPGGQKMLDVLGLGKVFDDLAERVAPALKRLSTGIGEFLKDVLGSGDKKNLSNPSDGGQAQSFARSFLNNGIGSSIRKDSDLPNLGKSAKAGGGLDKQVADDVVFKGAPGGAAEGAAAEGGILGGVEALAGPIGIAILALGALGEVGEHAAESIRGFGQIGAEIVANNPAAAMRRAAEGVISWLDEIPIVGKALTGLPKVILAVSDAFSMVRDAFLQNAKKLEQYSGNISAAESLAEVRHMLADLDEAQRTGPKLSQVVTIQSEIEVEFQKAMVPFKEDMLEILVPMMEFAKDNVQLLRQFLETTREQAQPLKDLLGGSLSGFGILSDFYKWARDNFGNPADDGKDDFNELTAAFQSIDPGAESGVPRPAPDNPGFGGAPG